MHSKNYAQAQPNKYCIHCVLEAKAQVQNNAAVSKDKSNSDLCTFAAGEVLYQLCFRNEGSGAKQCSGSEEKANEIGSPEKV